METKSISSLLQRAIECRRLKGVSCVVANNSIMRAFNRRGVADLYTLLDTEPTLLRGSVVADKVVGKGAAVIMVAGGVTEVFSEVMSRPAAELFALHNVAYHYATLVDNIINRTGTGICPIESLCLDDAPIEEYVSRIEQFIQHSSKTKLNSK